MTTKDTEIAFRHHHISTKRRSILVAARNHGTIAVFFSCALRVRFFHFDKVEKLIYTLFSHLFFASCVLFPPTFELGSCVMAVRVIMWIKRQLITSKVSADKNYWIGNIYYVKNEQLVDTYDTGIITHRNRCYRNFACFVDSKKQSEMHALIWISVGWFCFICICIRSHAAASSHSTTSLRGSTWRIYLLCCQPIIKIFAVFSWFLFFILNCWYYYYDFQQFHN